MIRNALAAVALAISAPHPQRPPVDLRAEHRRH